MVLPCVSPVCQVVEVPQTVVQEVVRHVSLLYFGTLIAISQQPLVRDNPKTIKMVLITTMDKVKPGPPQLFADSIQCIEL